MGRKKGSGAGRGRDTSTAIRIKNDLLATCHEIVRRQLARQRSVVHTPPSNSEAVGIALFWLISQVELRQDSPERQAEFWREWDEYVEREKIPPGVMPAVPGAEYDAELEHRYGIEILPREKNQ